MESNLCYTSPYDCDSNDTVSSKLSLESSAFAYSDSVNESGYSSSSLLSPPEILVIYIFGNKFVHTFYYQTDE